MSAKPAAMHTDLGSLFRSCADGTRCVPLPAAQEQSTDARGAHLGHLHLQMCHAHPVKAVPPNGNPATQP